MKNIGFLRGIILGGGAVVGIVLGAGCGSNSSVTATIPLTPTGRALRQIVTPVPTETAIPEP